MDQVDVLVVGAGPTGLTVASVLAEGGVDVRLIDERTGPVRESRAAIVHVRTLETWDRLGVAGAAIEQGVPVRDVSVRVAGRSVARFALARRGPGLESGSFDHALALPQSSTERILGEALDRRGGHLTWRTRLLGFEQRDGAVDAVVRDPGGSVLQVRARFLVGADGARSVVRGVAGVDFPGGSYAPTAFLADVSLDPPPAAGVVHLNLAKGGFVGILHLGPGRFRLFGALSPAYADRFGVDSGRPIPEQLVQRWFDEYFGVPARVSDIGWTSTYRIQHRLATRFRAGDVFLAGDAAHLHAPAGGQGMNLGIGDAVNLGWKLAAVISGYGRPALLDSYEQERRPVAGTVLRGADRGFELEASDNPVLEVVRRTVLPLAVTALARLPATQRMIFRLFAQTWIEYRSSSIVSRQPPGGHGVRPGDRVPPHLVAAGGRRPASAVVHQPLLVADNEHIDRQAADLERLVAEFLPAHPPLTVHPDTPAGRRLSPAPRIILIRPDGHAGYVGPADDLPALRAYLHRWYTGTTSPAA